jgi:hypothetical protein
MEGEAYYHKHWIKDSAYIFKKSFGYASNSFIAPAYIWDTSVNEHLAEVKVKTLQGIKLQYEPKRSSAKNNYNRKPNYIGQTDKKSGLVFSPRNTFFEPSSASHKNWVDITLAGVKLAFEMNKPSIIGSHRINYVGSLNERNRTKNLAMLKIILQKIVLKYPNVEFISSNQLANLIV